jgi:hypothetical protein
MDRLGLAQEMKAKTMLLGGGGRAVAAGRVQYGFSIVADGIGFPASNCWVFCRRTYRNGSSSAGGLRSTPPI